MRDRYRPFENANVRERSVWKGAIAGAAAGLGATYAMTQFQNIWSAVTKSAENDNKPEPEPATAKAAALVSKKAFGHEMTKREKQRSGPVVHYGFGTMIGALYGAAAEVDARVRIGTGLPYGAAVWLGADEVAVPALGLSEGPNHVPLSTHAYALLSHLVYGASLEGIRRTIRRML